MSWALFIDESGQDQRHSPYEVLAGLAVEDKQIWPLIRQLSDAQDLHFGLRLFEAYGKEAKAKKLLDRRTFKHASQLETIPHAKRRQFAREILEDGTAVTRERLAALGQAKVAYSYYPQRKGSAHVATTKASDLRNNDLSRCRQGASRHMMRETQTTTPLICLNSMIKIYNSNLKSNFG